MARINLRPWREERRAERQKQFLTVIGGVVVLSAGLGFLWHEHQVGEIEQQHARNNFLKSEMAQLDKQIVEIRELKKRRDELLDRMRVIQDLQGKRPVIVRVFDEMVRTLPDGVYYEKMGKTADTVRITGVAEANSRISSLMRNLEASSWFSGPNLTSVKAINADSGESRFELSVKQVTPDSSVKEGEKQ